MIINWSRTFKSCESLYCTPVTYVILDINYISMKKLFRDFFYWRDMHLYNTHIIFPWNLLFAESSGMMRLYSPCSSFTLSFLWNCQKTQNNLAWKTKTSGWGWKWKSLSCVQLFVTPWIGILQAKILEYWSG